MNDNNKNDTFIFKPEEDVKPHINRTANDTYSSARRGTHKKKEEEKISPLAYVAIGLAVVICITIIIGVLVLKSGGNQDTTDKPKEPSTVISGEEENPEDETEEEITETVNFYELMFNEEKIFLLESGDGYAISADLYDNSGKSVDTRRVRITKETEIRDNGQRISVDAFISVVENQGGDKIFFGSEIREEDDVVMYIAYDSRTFEEDIPNEINPPEETEDEIIIPETPETPEIPVEGEVDVDSSTPAQGI